MDIPVFVLSFAIILLGCEFFTNGVEWAGKRFKLSEGCIGSVLAALQDRHIGGQEMVADASLDRKCGVEIRFTQVVEKNSTDAALRWNAGLIAVTFLLCIFGTFLTRSGIVSSVHAFAQSSIGTWFSAPFTYSSRDR